ncbi:MAG: hypothetical protein EHM17_02790 [Verrucomicrobiaceae bacterium]|nr:MAG: hypothetical protein EHM17_02790 [Verrucomicrobiaceae bacterium]
MKKLLTALCAGLLLGSCAPSTPLARIQREPQKFEALSTAQRALVEQGQIERGMSQDAVYLAWGAPSRVFQGSKDRRMTERWDYAGSRPVYYSNFHGSYGRYWGPRRGRGYHGGYGMAFGPEVAYVPYRIASVWFVDNQVDAWERAR